MNHEEKPQILIVDDELLNIEILSSMINMPTDSALTSTDGLTFIRIRLKEVLEGRSNMYKLILLDYSIDEMDGP